MNWRTICALVPAALKDGEVDAIHQARVTTRRLRAALNLLGPVIPAKTQKPVAKTLRQLRRQLGPLRDADVMLGHLGELKRYSRHAPAIGWLEDHLTNRREQAATDALDDAPPAKTLAKLGAWWGVSEQIAGTGKPSMRSWPNRCTVSSTVSRQPPSRCYIQRSRTRRRRIRTRYASRRSCCDIPWRWPRWRGMSFRRAC